MAYWSVGKHSLDKQQSDHRAVIGPPRNAQGGAATNVRSDRRYWLALSSSPKPRLENSVESGTVVLTPG